MKLIKKFQLFLFDFDGLLVNTEYLHFEAYQEMCRSRGFELKWDFIRFCKAGHLDSSGLREGIYADLPGLYEQEPRWEILYEEKKEAYLQCLKSGKLQLMPGVKEVLETLDTANVKRCVVTNSTKEQTDWIKGVLPELSSIPIWITREDYSLPKPAPDGYLKALELLKKPGERAVGFEDTLKGLKSLWEAKVDHCVLICPPDHPQLECLPDMDVQHCLSFKDLG